MNNGKISAMTSGKFSEFKKEEYNTMMIRISAINKVLTSKCNSLSLMPLGMDFSFSFEFIEIDSYLKKIEDFDKKPRKDPLKKWWMNQKASEMATTFLPSIFDRIDLISLKLSKQEKSELLQHKLMKYIQFCLLECAIECKFTRPRSAAASVFPNTSFQYARSRLRKKLQNVYLNETETNAIKPNDRKKKEEWIKLIKIKQNKYKNEYYKDKLKKQKHKKKQKQKIKNAIKSKKMESISMSSSITISESMRSSTASSSDLPIMDRSINDNVPPPPPLPPLHDIAPSDINQKHIMSMYINQKQRTRYCSQCTAYSIQLSKLTEDIERFKLSLGSTQMQLQQSLHETNEWKLRYKEKCDLIKSYNEGNNETMHWKQKYDKKSLELKRLQSQIGSLVANSNHMASSSSGHSMNNEKISLMNNDSNPFECLEDKMSISGGSSIHKYNFMNQNDSNMTQLMAQHLKHNSNSTEKMLEQLRSEHKDDMNAVNTNSNDSAEYGLCQEEESLLFPITTNNNNKDNNSQSAVSQTTTQSTFSSMNHNNYGNYGNQDYTFNHGHHRNKQHIQSIPNISAEEYHLNAMNMNDQYLNTNGNGYWNDNRFPPPIDTQY